MFSELEEDPFFSEPFRSHHEHLRQMMANVPNFVGQDEMPNLPTSNMNEQECSRQPATNDEGAFWMDPFSRMNTMMEQVRKEMLGMQTKHGTLSSDSSGHSLNSSSVMTYAKVGNEPPRIFQASSHVHNVPGGIKETRRAVRDTESGIEKMSVGHHIQDRAHVIQKSRNQRTGDEEIDQEYININEADVAGFDQEWESKVSNYLPPGKHPFGVEDVRNSFEDQSSSFAV
ncbi:myeloid leukemia factor 1 isoform X2 [Heterodontus francisci]|uniref:myeloid leukemia factor 1 isoform X2 n=1 Tax=Heterodontus francisci TaxID=7792 RepID=UPI00355C75E8